ncbi:hypothetical protein ACQY0O_004522 [Thecaphora frezii]
MLHSSAIAGACAGLVSSVVTCPLDVVKTRLQAQEGRRPSGRPPAASLSTSPSPPKGVSPRIAVVAGDMAVEQGARYLGLVDTLKRIWLDDGIRGFYRGLGPTIFGYLPTWAIYFTVYDSCKQMLAHDVSATGEEDFLNHILSAMTAGAASTICTSPLWVVKTRFMLQSGRRSGGGGGGQSGRYRHTGDAFVQIFRTEGWRGFYKGLIPSLFGVSHVAVQFPLYEAFKSYARRHLPVAGAGADRDGDGGGEGGGGGGELTPGMILACSSSAKMIASVTTYPHEVLRTRLQMQPKVPDAVRASSSSSSAPASTSSITTATTAAREGGTGPAGGGAAANRYSGVWQASMTILRLEGWRGFYKGMAVNLVRTVPSSALTILTYEVIMQHLQDNPS